MKIPIEMTNDQDDNCDVTAPPGGRFNDRSLVERVKRRCTHRGMSIG